MLSFLLVVVAALVAPTMSKISGRSGGKAKSGKTSSKGCGSEVAAVRHEKLSTSKNSNVVTLLRGALHNDDGTDRNLLSPFPSFTRFARNGLQLAIEFRCGKQLDKMDAKAAFMMAKAQMEDEYDASGYGWDDDDKMEEITSRESRLLLLFDTSEPRRLVGFVSFRLTLQGECWNAMEGAPCLYVSDIQLLPEVRHRRALSRVHLPCSRSLTSAIGEVRTQDGGRARLAGAAQRGGEAVRAHARDDG